MSDAEEQFSILRTLMATLNNRILTDPKLNATGATYLSYKRTFMFGQLQETPIAELRLAYEFKYRTVYPPAITDDYKRLRITTEIGEAGTPVLDYEYDVETGKAIVPGGKYDENGDLIP